MHCIGKTQSEGDSKREERAYSSAMNSNMTISDPDILLLCMPWVGILA
jgi:hypothetical protein